jgi:hypothetical protein
MLAREKPHCGVSGVPFMKSTTGAEATALSIAALVSVERRREAMGENLGEANRVAAGRTAWRSAWVLLVGYSRNGERGDGTNR